MKRVEIFTDGSCRGNPGPGGWAAILRYKGREKKISGGEADTTNNRMELMGVIKAFNCLKEPCEVILTSDSKYVCNALSKGWAKSWRSRGWRKWDNEPALNSDLWKILLDLMERHQVTVQWVKGHAGHPENECCDRMAVSASKKFS